MKFVSPIILVLSFVFILVALLTLPVIILATVQGDPSVRAFLWTDIVCIIMATLGLFALGHKKLQVSSRQLYLITTSSWCLLALMGALPLYFGVPGLSFTNAVFESVSGITTTGGTVLNGLDAMPQPILLWRGLLNWVGGIGIIVISIAVLPFLRIGGMRLFATESSDWSGKTVPRVQVLIRGIGAVYLILSVITVLSYWFAGMGLFDAVVHAMTTVSTGGFANYDASFGHFSEQPLILWLGSIFMLLGALPFMLYVSVLRGNARPLLRDSQVRGFLAFVGVIVLMLSAERMINGNVPILQAFTHASFNVISIVTTTGLVSQDYTQWDFFAVVVFFYLMFLGGCSGSTSGSIKVFRFQVAIVMLRNQLRVMRHHHAVYTSQYNGRLVTDDIVRSIVAFSFYFTITIAVTALGLSLTGLDFVTSLSAAVACVTNVGPGLGDVVGPAGSYAPLPDAAKWLLSIGMLLGRLEIMTVIILLTPTFWRT